MEERTTRILCIDDDPDILEILKLILEAHGYEVLQASCAEEGLKVFLAGRPDLVFVDLMMEEIDAGTNFVKEVKMLGTKVPIYLLSSMGDTLHQSVDHVSLGLTGVLQKPVNPEALLKLVHSKLG